MARTLALCTAPWGDLNVDDVARKAAEFGYRGLELAVGEHFSASVAVSDGSYLPELREVVDKHAIEISALFHPTGQAILDRLDERHALALPKEIWGDGQAEGVVQRATEDLKNTARAAQRLGVETVTGYVGSSLWAYYSGYPPVSKKLMQAGFDLLAERLNPVLDVFGECGVRFALCVASGQIACDLPTAEQALAALDDREEFGFSLDPSQMLWQGIDPVELIRAFPERIYHVRIKDAIVTLDGRTGILSGQLPFPAHRGWEFRSPGHGRVDFAELFRALNQISYTGPLSVDWSDPGMDRDHGAREAAEFLSRWDFPASSNTGES